jgi:hypothetical protein
MKVAFGLKAHSGWVALVVVGKQSENFVVVDRRRLELVQEQWQKQPYHAAETSRGDEARAVVNRGVTAARSGAVRELRRTIKLEQQYKVSACAVLVGEPMPKWSTDEILAVHFRMHKAEGVLFREVLIHAAKTCGLKVVTIPEKQLQSQAESTLRIPTGQLPKMLTTLGKTVGAPWGNDQKEATLAAMIALQGS